MTTADGPRAGRREWLGMGVLVLPLLLISMDVSVLYFAVPFISADLAPTSTEQLWIFDIYGFVLAGLLLTMGSLGDRIGRRRLLMLGATAFGAASVAAAYATSAEMLIAARALLGIGGATLMPSTLALIRNMFHNEKQRSTAVAIWTSAMMSGIALGPVLSGFLLEHFWWGSVFLINTPVMVLLLVLAPILLPEFKDPKPGRFDLVGSALSLATVLPVIYGIKEISAHGLNPSRVACIAAGLAFGVVFLVRQRIRTDPMLDLQLFRRRGFSGSIVTNMVAAFAVMGTAIFTTQYMQSVLGMSPLRAALWCVLPSLGVAVAAPTASVLAQRVNRAYVISAGFLVAALGFVGLAKVQVDTDLWLVLVTAGVLNAGIVIVMTLVNDMAIGTVPPERAGSASALLETGSEFGGALGMAILGSIGAAVYRGDVAGSMPAGLSPDALNAVRETLGSATVVAGRLPQQTGDAVLHGAREAFTHGMHAAAIANAAVMIAAAVLATLTLRHVRPAPSSNGPTSHGPTSEGPSSTGLSAASDTDESVAVR